MAASKCGFGPIIEIDGVRINAQSVEIVCGHIQKGGIDGLYRYEPTRLAVCAAHVQFFCSPRDRG